MKNKKITVIFSKLVLVLSLFIGVSGPMVQALEETPSTFDIFSSVNYNEDNSEAVLNFENQTMSDGFILESILCPNGSYLDLNAGYTVEQNGSYDFEISYATEANPTELLSMHKTVSVDKINVVDDATIEPLIQTPIANLEIVSDFDSLKAAIESATADIEIQLLPGVYNFTSEIKNTSDITITLMGTTDALQITTEFVMDNSVTGAPRFIRAQSGSLVLTDLKITGTKGKSGGVSARNVSVDNTIFENNFTNDGVSGGGAIRVTGGKLNVLSSTFIGNSVGPTSDGGAISSEYSGDVYIHNSHFDKNERIGNSNQYGGAINIKQPSVANTVVSITDSTFTNNINNADGNLSTGGAIRIFGTSNLQSVLIDNVLFKSNSTKTMLKQSGGAIGFMNVNNSTISNCTL